MVNFLNVVSDSVNTNNTLGTAGGIDKEALLALGIGFVIGFISALFIRYFIKKIKEFNKENKKDIDKRE